MIRATVFFPEGDRERGDFAFAGTPAVGDVLEIDGDVWRVDRVRWVGRSAARAVRMCVYLEPMEEMAPEDVPF